MTPSSSTLAFTFERIIPAAPEEVFDAWLNPAIPGNLWNMAEKLIFDPKVDGVFYWTAKGTPHYGRFTEMERPARIEHTSVSPNTLGEESKVSLTFRRQGKDTLLTLVHSGIPYTERGQRHQQGWNYFLNLFSEQFRVGQGAC
jgi:uncharacterized protein YndB with AHSA1/START domain